MAALSAERPGRGLPDLTVHTRHMTSIYVSLSLSHLIPLQFSKGAGASPIYTEEKQTSGRLSNSFLAAPGSARQS